MVKIKSTFKQFSCCLATFHTLEDHYMLSIRKNNQHYEDVANQNKLTQWHPKFLNHKRCVVLVGTSCRSYLGRVPMAMQRCQALGEHLHRHMIHTSCNTILVLCYLVECMIECFLHHGRSHSLAWILQLQQKMHHLLFYRVNNGSRIYFG